MPTFQPKVSTRYRQYPCRVCKIIKPDKDTFITGIDENNASITKYACQNPICRDCYCLSDPKHYVCEARPPLVHSGDREISTVDNLTRQNPT